MLSWSMRIQPRNAPRYPVVGTAEILAVDRCISGQLINISETGMLMRTDKDLRLGTAVVRFTVDGFGEKFFAPVFVMRGGEGQAALWFLEAPPLQAVLESLAQKHPPLPLPESTANPPDDNSRQSARAVLEQLLREVDTRAEYNRTAVGHGRLLRRVLTVATLVTIVIGVLAVRYSGNLTALAVSITTGVVGLCALLLWKSSDAIESHSGRYVAMLSTRASADRLLREVEGGRFVSADAVLQMIWQFSQLRRAADSEEDRFEQSMVANRERVRA